MAHTIASDAAGLQIWAIYRSFHGTLGDLSCSIDFPGRRVGGML